MPLEDIQLEKKDALLVNYVRLHALHSQLLSNLNPDQMVPEELLSMI